MTGRIFTAIQRWKSAALIAIAMVILSLVPQVHLWIVRGHGWNGAYVSAYGDEPLYSAYVNALVEGRPRKNDPFGVVDNTSASQLPESIYSIQFIPAYLIALPARLLGVSTSTAFIVLIAISALCASLAVFWLLKLILDDKKVAAAGALFVLCLGGLFGSYGIFDSPIDIAYPVLPFLRRYEPAAAFPLYFVFNAFVWQALTSDEKRRSRLSALAAGSVLILLIFSYLYLWTAAAVWVSCLGLLWFFFRPADRRKAVELLLIVAGLGAVALVPYFYMLAHRAPTLDQQQILTLTHKPDFLRSQIILGTAILFALLVSKIRRRITLTDNRVIYAASVGLLPFMVLNQQVITGRTLQVFHFEAFVVNYSTAVGLLVTMVTLWGQIIRRRLIVWLAVLSFLWGVIAAGLPARLVFVPQSVVNDKMIPVLLRLKELTAPDDAPQALKAQGNAPLVYSPSVTLIAWLPTWTSQGTLLDISGVDCGVITMQKRKQFFFMHLYYSNVTAEAFRKGLNGAADESRDALSSVRSVVFGYGKIFRALNSDFQPIKPEEIEQQVQLYQTYINTFSRDEVLMRPIKYAVIPIDADFDFSHLDLWYQRDAGERVGDYVLYTLKLK
jgi:hypothetical protein